MTLKEIFNKKAAELNTIRQDMQNNGKSSDEIQKFITNEITRFTEELAADKSIDIKKEIEEKGLKGYKPSGNIMTDFLLYMILGK